MAQLLRLGHGGIGAKPGSASSEAVFGPPGLPLEVAPERISLEDSTL